MSGKNQSIEQQSSLTILLENNSRKNSITSTFKKISLIVRTEWIIEMRSKEVVIQMLAFGTLASLIFSINFDLRIEDHRSVAPGALWVSIFFTGLLCFNRSFAREVSSGSLVALLLTPINPRWIYLGKLLANFLFITPGILLFALINTALYDINLLQFSILLIVFIGVFGYVAVGTLLAAITLHRSSRDLLLPLLLLGTTTPIFISGVGLTMGLLYEVPLHEMWSGWIVLGFSDLLFFALGWFTFSHIWEDYWG